MGYSGLLGSSGQRGVLVDGMYGPQKRMRGICASITKFSLYVYRNYKWIRLTRQAYELHLAT